MYYLNVPFSLLSLSWILNLVGSHCTLLSSLLGLSSTDSVSTAEVIVSSVPEMINPRWCDVSHYFQSSESIHWKLAVQALFIVARDSREYFFSTHYKPILFWPHKKPKWVLCSRFPFFMQILLKLLFWLFLDLWANPAQYCRAGIYLRYSREHVMLYKPSWGTWTNVQRFLQCLNCNRNLRT